MGNFELLVRCLPIVREQVCALIECASKLSIVRTGDLELISPVPGSIPPDDLPEVEEALALVRDIEAVVGKKWIGPQWFDDMVFYGVGGRPQQGGAS